ncbi:hypothetical protein L3Q82_011167 [Scortum barcoo]|uniref:Uncharacterized protein n=1 Tax=Scortum barcoo TaxID=214431 RepID=A0ACB8W9D3_9TELE|nr:hypothetical protein L3Q82_011167 [Scortum barcoo]
MLTSCSALAPPPRLSSSPHVPQMSAASTETSAPLPTAGSRVFFQSATGVGCVGSGPIAGDDPVQKKQGKVTVKYDRKELRKRLVLEEWIIEQLSELYDCEVTGQTKSGSQAHHEKKNIKDRYVARIGVTGAPPWSQAWGWGSQASAWWPGPGRAQPEMADVGPPSSRLTTRRKVHEGPVQCGLGSSRGRGPRRPNPWTKTLAIGTWNVTSLGGKEPELVREVERYRLEIVGLTSTAHSLGSGTQLLERGWTLHYSGVAQGERRRAGVGLLIAPQLSRHVLEFTPVNERVASLRLRVGDRSLAVVCALRAEQQYRVPGLLGVPGRGT